MNKEKRACQKALLRAMDDIVIKMYRTKSSADSCEELRISHSQARDYVDMLKGLTEAFNSVNRRGRK